jgi:cation diffusion facilitator CzcD-associated flavoprotein CzcO
VTGARGLRVVVVGAGLGGIAAAIELRKHGFDDIRILEKAPAPGGMREYQQAVTRLDPSEYEFT